MNIVVETGESSTAVGPGQTRDEVWNTTLYVDERAASLKSNDLEAGNYGYNKSSRLQYTLMFCSATPKMLCTGNLATYRSIDLSCCDV